ncbi:LAME_0G03158g1_1 [Lachancea meyersii CBS 8951]|uniref:LAME_0G03158g1_1 n=1 Tax=Lachancea meyersii CBS 8951 TaxID=1266667 RepID=A0A1G4K6G8_9SACH|nr:LAME_0G03158g1_1 [Lachancea meyersii CBS 8951]
MYIQMAKIDVYAEYLFIDYPTTEQSAKKTSVTSCLTMAEVERTDLVQALSSSDDKEHVLMTWTTEKLSKTNVSDRQFANYICTQFQCLLKELIKTPDFTFSVSLALCQQVSVLYAMSLGALPDNEIYDGALFLASTLCEEDFSHSKSKKKSRNKTHVYSAERFLSVVSLAQLVNNQPQKLISLLPSLLPDVLKSIKKMLEKEKHMHAGFLTNLMVLVSYIYKDCDHIDPVITAKLVKTFKIVLERVKADDESLPKPFLSAIICTYAHLYKNWKFVEAQSSGSPLETFKTKFFHGGYGLYGLSCDELRQDAAFCLGDILYNWCFEREAITLEEVLAFFSDVFITVPNRSVRAGVFECLSHFLGIAISSGSETLGDGKYLEVVSKLAFSIFTNPTIKEQKLDNISRYMKFFEILHQSLLRYISESGKLLTLFSIFGCEKDSSDNLLKDKEGEVLYSTIVFLQLGTILMETLSSTFTTNSRNLITMKSRLIELSSSSNFQIRVHGSRSLRTFASHAPHLLPEILGSSLELLANELFTSSNFSFSRCHGYTFLLANLIKVCSPEYVPTELVMRITIFATTILKDHPPSNGLTSYNKQLVSWILLCGLMNYNDVDFLRIQSSQLFLFWKGILTHAYTYGDEDELYKNLEVRNHALACLLSYLNRIDLNADIAKQVFFLLTKCSTFNNSIQLKTKTIDNILLQNENRILQTYLKIHEFIKNEFNSAVLILIVKNFADPNLYCEPPRPLFDRVPGNAENASKANLSDSQILNLRSLLRDDSGFAYGLTSKVNYLYVDELKIKKGGPAISKELRPWKGESGYWFARYESEIYSPVTSVLSYDCLILLYGGDGYMSNDEYSPRVTTSIINSSIEVFSLIFPFLNDKIQLSVLESMNSCVFSKKTVSMRSIAIATNCCVALLGALEVVQSNSMKLEQPVANLMLKILRNIPSFNDEFMTRLKAECVGLVLSTASPSSEIELSVGVEYANEISDVIVKDIFDHDDSFSRIFNILSLCCAFKYKRRNFNFWTALGLLENLIKDPHPIVHAWSVEALSILIEGSLVLDMSTASQILHLLEFLIVDERYGGNATMAWRSNYSCRFDSRRMIAKILLSVTQLLGPEIKLLPPATLARYKTLLYVMIGSTDGIENLYGIRTLTNLAAFKMLDDFDPGVIIPATAKFLRQSFTIDLTPHQFSGMFSEAVLHFGGAYNECIIEAVFELMDELVSLKLFDSFFEKLENLVWRYFSVFPDAKCAQSFVNGWFVHTASNGLSWLNKLYNLFFITRQQLFDLELKSRGIHVGHEKDDGRVEGHLKSSEIIDVEEKGFTSEFTTCTKVNVLSWQVRLYVLKLLGDLLAVNTSAEELWINLQNNLSKVIKLCFSASAMKISQIKARGIEILGEVIGAFTKNGNSADLLSLEEEEAHIVSALMPAFDEGSSPAILPIAINVCAQYLCLCYSSAKKSCRIVEVLVNSLADMIEKPDSLIIGEVKVSTPKCKSDAEVAILNSWARITVGAIEKHNQDLLELSKPFWNTLTPLWIISLREYVSMQNVKSGQSSAGAFGDAINNQRDSSIYEDVWINFTEAICFVYSEDATILTTCLKREDLENFVFVIYAQCLQQLTLSFEDKNVKLRTLDGIRNVLKIDTPCELFFRDENVEETVEVFERIVLTGRSGELLKLVDVIEGLASKFFQTFSGEDEFISGADKVYLLLRVLLMIITSKLTFLKEGTTDSLSTDEEKESLGHEDFTVVKKCFSSISHLICKFPVEFRMDLNACMLFIVGQIFQSSKRQTLAPAIMPLLKQIISIEDPSDEEKRLVTIFFEAEKNNIFKQLPKELALATLLILSKYSDSTFSETDVELIVQTMLSSLAENSCLKVTQGVFEGFLRQASHSISCRELVRRFVTRIIKNLQNLNSLSGFENPNTLIELLFTFTENMCRIKPESQIPILTLCLSVLISIYEQESVENSLIISKIIVLFELFTDSCKEVLRHHLKEDQKELFSKIVIASNSDTHRQSRASNQIELRSFI